MRSTGYFHALAILCLSLYAFASIGQNRPNESYWSRWDDTRKQQAGVRYALPNAWEAYDVDIAAIRGMVRNAPYEFTLKPSQSTILLRLPLPDGSFQAFGIVRSRVMHADLEAAFPDIQTFSGQGIENPSAMLKLSITPKGFHAMILSPEGVFYIDPWQSGNQNECIVYRKEDLAPYSSFSCETEDHLLQKGRKTLPQYSPFNNSAANRTHGTQLRTYRLALACTGEYTQFHGGTKSSALAAMVVSMNRVNGIYESEVAVRMVIIPNDTLIIYTNSATDPYTNNSGSTMLGENQTNIDAVIGNANYDVGHVFSTGGGGVAQLAVPCVTGSKARGVTGLGSPVGDAFDVDYVAHEIGHQFAALHTFNSATGSCSGNRSSSAAFEPGSGITIMAYAGICGSDNLAPNSIAYFHTYSFDQIVSFITTGAGNNCPVNTATGNNPPNAVPAGLNYTIPFQTPFQLSATASDPNGDPVTFSWEQFDLGPSGSWNNPSGNAPVFRPFSPVSSGTRVFPKLSDILNNTTTIGEILPSYARSLFFRVTVRDNRVGGGGVMHIDDTVKVNVINTTTPFSVTAPNNATIWYVGQSVNVTWNVSSTNLAPINCASVNVLLSTDGGNTFPITLASATPNDGSHTVTVPSNLTTQARVRVEAVGNIFFDISNANFSIQNSSPVLSVINTDALSATQFCAGQTLNVSFTANGNPNAGNTYSAQLSNSSGSFSSPVVIGTLASVATAGVISCTLPAGTAQGTGYRVRVVSSTPVVNGSNNGSNITILGVAAAAGAISGASSVCQGQTGVVFSIASVANATSYAWTVPTGVTITAGSTTNSITASFSTTFAGGVMSVIPSNACGNGTVSPNFTLSVSPLPGAAGAITGSNSLCQGAAGVVYSVAAISNATGYSWTLPSGASITGGANTNSITVSYSASALSGNVVVLGTNACGSGTSSTSNVIVNPTPATPVISSSGSLSICSGGSVVLQVNPAAGVSYQWRRNGANISGATGTTYSATQAGSYDVVATPASIPPQLFTNSTSFSIPDNSCTGANSPITVTGYNFPVRSSGIYVRLNNITHTYVGDLDIFLEGPNGQRLGISDQTGNSNNGGDNFINTVLADSGAARIPTTGAPYTNLYRPWNLTFAVNGCGSVPSTNLTAFAGFGDGLINPNGTWTLRTYDRFSTDTGSVNSWSLFFPGQVYTCTSVSNTLNVTLQGAPTISSLAPSAGLPGIAVVISGSNFNGTSSVIFNGIPATITAVTNTQINVVVPVGATTGPLVVTTPCGSASSTFTVNVTLNLTVLVEGLYNGGGQMTGVLSPSVSDTVRLQIRNTTAPYAVVFTGLYPLNLSGQASILLPGSLSGNSYYIVVKHRNSIETWSKLPVAMLPVTNYSFKQ